MRIMLAVTGEKYKEAVPGFESVTHLSEPAHLKHLRDEGLLIMN